MVTQMWCDVIYLVLLSKYSEFNLITSSLIKRNLDIIQHIKVLFHILTAHSIYIWLMTIQLLIYILIKSFTFSIYVYYSYHSNNICLNIVELRFFFISPTIINSLVFTTVTFSAFNFFLWHTMFVHYFNKLIFKHLLN